MPRPYEADEFTVDPTQTTTPGLCPDPQAESITMAIKVFPATGLNTVTVNVRFAIDPGHDVMFYEKGAPTKEVFRNNVSVSAPDGKVIDKAAPLCRNSAADPPLNIVITATVSLPNGDYPRDWAEPLSLMPLHASGFMAQPLPSPPVPLALNEALVEEADPNAALMEEADWTRDVTLRLGLASVEKTRTVDVHYSIAPGWNVYFLGSDGPANKVKEKGVKIGVKGKEIVKQVQLCRGSGEDPGEAVRITASIHDRKLGYITKRHLLLKL